MGKEEACYFTRAENKIAENLRDQVMERVRLYLEACDYCQGVMIYNSSGGGTGSGLYGMIENKIARDYSKLEKMNVTVFSSPNQSTSVVEPYNTTNALDWMLEYSDLNILLDNQALNRICEEKL